MQSPESLTGNKTQKESVDEMEKETRQKADEEPEAGASKEETEEPENNTERNSENDADNKPQKISGKAEVDIGIIEAEESNRDHEKVREQNPVNGVVNFLEIDPGRHSAQIAQKEEEKYIYIVDSSSVVGDCIARSVVIPNEPRVDYIM
jgi:hypothetical protein